ncbi:MAG: threonine dehydrogenase-like Zn-dependent dehydrogenase [Candidatus Latescibacterota bacterium]|jgi:threonine dehydrogenase-like Zn-dependent dehydrogenase
MRSIRHSGDSQTSIIDAADPVPGAGEVVVETAVSALCGSELKGYRADGMAEGNSGHEAVGTVVALGEGVASIEVGTRVGASAIAGCGHCAECEKGRYTWCAGRRYYGHMHAERFLAGANACYPLPDEMPWDAAVLLTGDGLGVPTHTAAKIDSKEIQTVAVFGVGPIGLGNVLLQVHLGRRVIAVDIAPARLEIAQRLGAADIIDASSADVPAVVRDLTDGRGADVCIEAAGREASALACFDAVRTNGIVVFNGEQGPLPLSPSRHFIRRDITAVGGWYYHFSEIPTMMDFYRDGLDVQALISHRFPFAAAEMAFETFAAGESGKVILEY